jgi:hypothetical protein
LFRKTAKQFRFASKRNKKFEAKPGHLKRDHNKYLLDRFRHINIKIAKNRFHVLTPVEDSLGFETHRITVRGQNASAG